jgi:hypothetical protein
LREAVALLRCAAVYNSQDQTVRRIYNASTYCRQPSSNRI